ncbi:MAG: ATP-dependent Clp protease adaptor ClpS [Ekhidna sp.]
MSTEFDIEEEILTDENIGSESVRDLMVYNDDFNTFDHVIDTLVKVCKHDIHQAEQCTFLIHYKGKCSVKKGSYEDLKPMREEITSAGIKASIV